MQFRSAITALLLASVGVAAQPTTEQPRFRGGANLVRVDAYFTKDGKPVTDLTSADVEVFEDDKPQKLEHFELVARRAPLPQSARVDPTSTSESRALASSPDVRLFTFFFDTLHVSLSGSYRAKSPLIETLDNA